MTSNGKEDSAVTSDTAAKSFPTALVQEKSKGLLRTSRMWWVTLACLLLAGWLAIQSMPATGPEIAIQFPEGHGLKTGDVVRYRGIEVGRVTSVTLNEQLSGIDVQVMLNPGNGALDREGTRFWIVRPKLSLTEVQGLETAVGAKYIGVSPGDPTGPHLADFTGLAAAPPDELDYGGLQVILRSNDRHGLSPGAPVTWRGVKAGKVLSVNLSPDARHVHTTIRIDRRYRKLVRSSSKFWVTSGFAVDVGLGGVKLNANSLSSILEGGISFVTLAEEKNAAAVVDGHVFRLTKEADKDWFKAESTVPLIDTALPETVQVKGQFTTSTLGISRQKEFTQNGILMTSESETWLITAAFPGSESLPTECSLIPAGKDAIDLKLKAEGVKQYGEGLVGIPVSQPASYRFADFQVMKQADDCLIFRSAVVDGKPTPVIQTVDLETIVSQNGQWVIQADGDFTEWHGAPVLSMSSGRIIGILTTEDGHAKIAAPNFSQLKSNSG